MSDSRPAVSDGERGLLQELVQSEGWKVLTRIWEWQRSVNTSFCEQPAPEPRFPYYQGFAAGFRHAEALARKFAEAPKTLDGKHVPNESALQAEPKREWV